MNNDRRSTAALWIVLLAGAAMFMGCSNSPTSVDSNAMLPSQQFNESVGCPDMEAVANVITTELNAYCPRTVRYRNWGQENSCEKGTIGSMLDQYEGCFSDEELKQIRARIQELRHAEDREPHRDDPTPDVQ
jgi:hypothetical protein